MRWLFFISVVFTCCEVFGQGSKFEATLNRESILIGEQLELSLRLSASAADSMRLPQFSDTLIKQVEIVSASNVDTTFEGSNLSVKVLTQNLTLTSFDSGYHAVAPLKSMVNGQIVESNPFLISVETVPIDTAKGIYDIRGVAQVPFSWMEWFKENWFWFAIVAAVLLIIVVFVIWFQRKPKKVIEEPKIPVRPAHEIALERLNILEGKNLWQSGKTKAFYSELTDILREYIEERFQIPAMEQTSDEIIRSMKHNPSFSSALIEKTHQVLFLADLVKFAKENPVGSENDQNLALVRTFITDTIPIEIKVNG